MYDYISEFFSGSTVPHWIAAGLILSILELIIPGVYLIWFGFAAFLMGVVLCFIPLSLTTQLIWFALFSMVFAVVGLYVYRRLFKRTEPAPEYVHLNDTAQQCVGLHVTVAEDVSENRTRVQVGDSYWVAYREKHLKKGDSAKVVGVKDSLILIIE